MKSDTIWKFPLTISEEQKVEMPAGNNVVSVQAIGDEIFVYAIVDKKAPMWVRRKFKIVGTGHPMPEEWGHFLGTVQILGGRMILHVFIGREDPDPIPAPAPRD